MSRIAHQTAMVLASLAPGDLAWIMKRLAPHRAARLGDLIDEASALGVETSAVMIGPMVDALERQIHPQDQRAALDLAPPGALCAALADQPARLVACLVAAEPWRWRKAFCERFSGPQKRHVLDALREKAVTCPPKLVEAIIAELPRTLRELPAPARPPAPASRLLSFARAHPLLRKHGEPR